MPPRFRSAQQKHAHAGLRFGDPIGEPPRAHRQCSNGGNRDRRTETHGESRRDADPEQALRQGKDKHDDRARTRPQADGNDRRKASSEPMLAGEFLRLRCVRVAPGRCVVVMVMVVGMGMHVAMMMIVAMRVVMIMAMVVIVVMVAMIVRMPSMLFATQNARRPGLSPTADAGRSIQSACS